MLCPTQVSRLLRNIVHSGAIVQLIAYGLLSPAGPFPLMCTAFCFAGFGISLQNAQGNGYVGALKNKSIMLCFLHASYGKTMSLLNEILSYLYTTTGLGAFAAPLVATQLASNAHWSFHYLISAGIGVSNVAFLAWVFKGKTQDGMPPHSSIINSD